MRRRSIRLARKTASLLTTSPPAISDRPAHLEDERLVERIREVHAPNYYPYGYRQTRKALLRAGENIGVTASSG